MTHPALIERITRSLAYMLRHQPEKFDVEVDAYGWADLEEVIRALNERLGEGVVEDDVIEAVGSGDRVRYEVDAGRIRALYGHSIEIEPGDPARPPEHLYIAVPARDVERARRFGLRGGRRRFVHLALTEEEACEAGRRIAREYTVLRILSLEAWEEGVNFYDRKSLFLAEEVPTHLLEVGETFDDGDPQVPGRADDERRHEPRRGRSGYADERGPRGGRVEDDADDDAEVEDADEVEEVEDSDEVGEVEDGDDVEEADGEDELQARDEEGLGDEADLREEAVEREPGAWREGGGAASPGADRGPRRRRRGRRGRRGGAGRGDDARGPSRGDEARGPSRGDEARGPSRGDEARGPSRGDEARGPSRGREDRGSVRPFEPSDERGGRERQEAGVGETRGREGGREERFAQGDRSREDRGRDDLGRRERGGRDDRPRRDERGPREERGRRDDRRPRDDRPRERQDRRGEAPARPREPVLSSERSREPAHPQPAGPSFGAGLSEELPKKAAPPAPPPPRAPEPPRKPEPEPKPPERQKGGSPGFGAGI